MALNNTGTPECSTLVEFEGEYSLVCSGETELEIDDKNDIYCVRCITCGKGKDFDNAYDAFKFWLRTGGDE